MEEFVFKLNRANKEQLLNTLNYVVYKDMRKLVDLDVDAKPMLARVIQDRVKRNQILIDTINGQIN